MECPFPKDVFAWSAPFQKMKADGSVSRWVRRHLTLSHTLGTTDLNRQRDGLISVVFLKFCKSLPSRIDATIMFIYFSLVVIFSAVDYKVVTPNAIFPDKKRQLLTLISDRCGIMATIQVPLLFAFAGRNNIFIFLTGQNYRNFNLFHRNISRIVWILLLIHACLYVSVATLNHDYQERWALQKWRWANVALICSGLSILVSSHFIRHRFYEFFKNSHQLMSLFFLVGAWRHCRTLGWMQPLYASFAIWGSDHLIRLMKILISGGVVWAKCDLLVDRRSEDGDIHSIRIAINHSGCWRCFPGCHVYLYFLKWSIFWESHPFTLLEPTKYENANQLVIMVKIKNGLTRRLGEYLQKQLDETLLIPVLVEGPYGSPIPFRSYENAIFVAGGIGITVVYTFAIDLIRQYKAEIARNEGVRSMTIIWVTKNVETVENFVNELKALNDTMFASVVIYITRDEKYTTPEKRGFPVVNSGLQHTGGIELSECVNLASPSQQAAAKDSAISFQKSGLKISETNSIVSDVDVELEKEIQTSDKIFNLLLVASGTKDNSLMNSEISERQLLANEVFHRRLPQINVSFCKPDLDILLSREIDSMKGTLAIVSCGPERMNRDIRRVAAHSVNMPTNERIDYFEEQLLW